MGNCAMHFQNKTPPRDPVAPHARQVPVCLLQMVQRFAFMVETGDGLEVSGTP